MSKHPLSIYEQLSQQVKESHLSYLIKYIKKHYNKNYILTLCHETFYDSSKRSVVRNLEKIKKEQVNIKGRIWYDITYEYFVGNDIVIKKHNDDMTVEELEKEIKRIVKQKKLVKKM